MQACSLIRALATMQGQAASGPVPSGPAGLFILSAASGPVPRSRFQRPTAQVHSLRHSRCGLWSESNQGHLWLVAAVSVHRTGGWARPGLVTLLQAAAVPPSSAARRNREMQHCNAAECSAT
jgi:hypothetical protein